MRPRYLNGIIIGSLAIIMLGISLQGGFDKAWLSQFTYAYKDNQLTSELAASVFNQQLAEPSASSAQDHQMNVQPPPQQQPLSKRVVEYHISVKLLEQTRQLSGEQTVTWTNPGKKPVTDLYFHLYPNAFRSSKTTFMKESGGKLRQDTATANSYGYMDLTSLQTLEGDSLLPRIQYVQPDDGNKHDTTLMKLRLPDPVMPGKSVTLKMGFDVKLPEVFARMGYSGDFVMAGQWFPKIAVYETAGTRDRSAEGWNLHQYHGNSGFYSSFGIYSVKINVPEKHIVAATGFQTKPAVTESGRSIYQFYAEDVHDFAWAASPDFIYKEFSFSEDNIPGMRIKLYLDPAHSELTERYIHAAKSSLTKLAKWYGPYPYSTLSVIVPPKQAGGAGGMEYPTLVTAFAADKENPGYELERVVAHEIAHQYWYGMVASNEFEEAWLDEGFTSYAEDKIMESVYGVLPNLRMEASYMTDPAPLKQESWGYKNHQQYAENVYMRSKLVLLDIENQIGANQMNKILRTYFKTYKFKHPTTSDFQKIVETITKTDWSDYFNSFVYNNKMADFEVEAIKVKTIRSGEEESYESLVTVRRNGEMNGSIPIVLKFTDGTTKTKVWNAEQARIQIKEVHSAPLEWAAIDPQQSNMLDNKLINNYMKAELPSEARSRWNLGVVRFVEGILKSLAW